MNERKLVFEEIDSNISDENRSVMQSEKLNKFDQFKYNRFWLLTLLIMIFVMVLVGGITRLTDSGLSIVEWNLVGGVIPPFSQSDWLLEFQKYKAIPEYALVNSAMTLEEFKGIFYWEWVHRLWGRLIGVVWFVGFAVFTIFKLNPPGWGRKFFLIGILIGFQGAVGWWMVKSGLSGEMTDVASYWLAIHLGIAFYIIAITEWYLLLLRQENSELMLSRRNRDKKLYISVNVFVVILSVQILLGALVAGIDAGKTYNDWPLMSGQIFPSDYFLGSDSLVNLLENPAFVQFNHRLTAYILIFVAIFTWIASRRSPVKFVRKIHSFMFLLVFGQFAVGIVTIFNGATIGVAFAHQLLALVLWIFTIWVRFETAYPRRQILA